MDPSPWPWCRFYIPSNELWSPIYWGRICSTVFLELNFHEFLVSKETVVLRRWERSKQKFGFIKRVDKGCITTVKDLESFGKAPLHSHINHNNPQFLYLLWRRANARNVSFPNLFFLILIFMILLYFMYCFLVEDKVINSCFGSLLLLINGVWDRTILGNVDLRLWKQWWNDH